MRILHVVASLDPNKGGPPLVATRLSSAQASAGHEVHLAYQHDANAQQRIDTAYQNIPGVAGVTMHPLSGWGFGGLTGAIARPLAKIMPNIDFVHIHGVWESLLRSTARMAHRHKVPYAIRPAGMLEPWSLAQKQLKKRIALMAAYRAMLGRAAFIHTLNDDERDLTRELGIPTPLEVFPNGIFFEEIEPLSPPGSFRTTMPALGDAPFVLFLARLHYKKGLDILAGAFDLLSKQRPDVHLVVVGPDGGARGDFEKRIGRAGLENRTHVLDGLYGRAKFDAMADAACFCLPSRQEGFSVAILEALASGAPVVCTDACHFPEIEQNGAGKIVALNEASVAEGLASVLVDPAGRQQLGHAATKLVRDHYQWSAISGRIVDAYDRYIEIDNATRNPVKPILTRAASPERLRIIHVITTLNPDHGGPPRVAARLCAAQAQQGHDVSLVCYLDAGFDAGLADLQSLPGGKKVRVHALLENGLFGRILATTASQLISRHIPAIDFIHIHSVWDPICYRIAHLAWRHKVPYCVLLNGMLDPWSMSQRRLKKQVAMRFAYRRMLSRASFLHTLNRDEAELIKPLKLTDRVEIIPNGVFAEEFAHLPAHGSFSNRFPVLAGKPYVLFLSRLHYKKGLDILADAFKIVASKDPSVHLVVAGPDGGALADFNERIKSAGLTARTHVVGALNGTDRYAAMIDSAVFCLPSRQEGFSVAILEALATATPVVITDGCHFPEVAEVGAGVVTPLDAEQVAEGLLKVLGTDDARHTIGDKGRELVLARYTWPRVARQCTDAYIKVIDSQQTRA